jgi:FtsH-binding integral membrane protein
MERWDQKRYEQEKHSFIQRRIHQSPLWGQFTFLFGISWGAAWLCSWFLWRFFAKNHLWASILPIRYAIAFLFAYGCFFIAVRSWIETVKHEPHQQNSNAADFIDGATYTGDAEGCFVLIALVVIGFTVGGLFLAAGGAPMLLEAAFEATFAGVVISRPLTGDLVLGNWKQRLLENTWKKALLSLLALIAMAAWLQNQAPQASTLAQAIREISH